MNYLVYLTNPVFLAYKTILNPNMLYGFIQSLVILSTKISFFKAVKNLCIYLRNPPKVSNTWIWRFIILINSSVWAHISINIIVKFTIHKHYFYFFKYFINEDLILFWNINRELIMNFDIVVSTSWLIFRNRTACGT